MKLSTKGKYGILAMYALAAHDRDDPVPISEIAAEQRIPKQYLDQLMTKLRQTGLVESHRGTKGGYTLSRPPGEITIGQVIRAVEEQTEPVECFGFEGCDHYNQCVAKVLWKKIADGISRVIDHETLEDMLHYTNE